MKDTFYDAHVGVWEVMMDLWLPYKVEFQLWNLRRQMCDKQCQIYKKREISI